MYQIPKIIHYCWFGTKPKPPIVLQCIASWEKYLPDYEIKEWNESNFDQLIHPYTRLTSKLHKWGCFTDYVRFHVLNEYGGIYLDADIEVQKSFNQLLANQFFVGLEDDQVLGTAIIGSVPNHPLVRDILERFNNFKKIRTGPSILTEAYKNYSDRDNIAVYPKDYFYPFGYDQNFTSDCLTSNTYTIHWWMKSWFGPKEYCWSWLARYPKFRSFLTKMKRIIFS